MLRSKLLGLKGFAGVAGLILAAAGPASATNLHLSVQSGGSNTVVALPGATVNYAVVGELSDAASDGLAAFSLNLTFSGGALSPANNPSAAPMTSFNRPAGLTNPAGYGGTVVSGALVQVGGAQNTIRNSFAPYPNGNVITDVAQIGQALPLVTGTLTAPLVPGNYTLVPSNVVANVILQGQTGLPFWRVEKAQPGALTPLVVIVGPLSPRKK
jgi:hypothetical protein